MSAKYFLDTNILVYSFDATEAAKQKRAVDLIAQALANQQGIVSYQVVQEFLNVATRKFTKPMSLAESSAYLHRVLMPLCRVFPSQELYTKALAVSHQFGFSWYDSIVITSAIQSGCQFLYSEDLQHGQQIETIRVENPFL